MITDRKSYRCVVGFRTMFGIDLRSLAVFRIAIAGILLADLWMRSQFLVENYTDAGVLPVEAVHSSVLSLHLFNGSSDFQRAIFVLAGLSAMSMLVGYRTRTATIVSWLLLRSLHIRNPGLLNAGDSLLGLLLFWSMFLPLGERFSIDAKRRSGQGAACSIFASAATAAILIQFLLLYVFTGLQKNGLDWVSTGTAIELSLWQEYWTRPFGKVLREYSVPLQYATICVRYFELIGPMILLLSFRYPRIRLLTIGAFWVLQLGISVCLDVHLFGWVSSIAAIPFLPQSVWETDPPCDVGGGVTTNRVPAVTTTVRQYANRFFQVIIAMLVFGAFLINLHQIDAVQISPRWLASSRYVGIYQNWRMYAPNAPDRSFSVELEGVTPDGSVETLVKIPGHGTWQEMQLLHSDFRFKYYLGDLCNDVRDRKNDPRLAYYFDWLHRQWHRQYGSPLGEMRMSVVTLRSPPQQGDSPQRYLLRVFRPSDHSRISE